VNYAMAGALDLERGGGLEEAFKTQSPQNA
jgi:hypothetical protein